MNEEIKDAYKELYAALVKLKSEEDCKIFLQDLCTIKEVDSMAQRIVAAKMLLNGETYESIIKKTNISSATLSRVSRCVKYSEGYKKILDESYK